MPLLVYSRTKSVLNRGLSMSRRFVRQAGFSRLSRKYFGFLKGQNNVNVNISIIYGSGQLQLLLYSEAYDVVGGSDAEDQARPI